jgi:gluconolactonase
MAAGRVVCNLQGMQLVDNLAVEAGGKVCSAIILNGEITGIDPDGSSEHIAFPDPICSNIFGGPDMQDAWVTATSTDRLFEARRPRPGLQLNFNA